MGVTIADRRNFAAGILYIIIGTAVAISSLDLSLGTARRMGAGFFPFVIALALVVTGLIVILAAIRRDAERTDLGEWRLRPVLTVSLAVISFALLLRPGGLILAVPVLIGICSLASGRPTPLRVLGTIAVLLPLSWVMFVQVLGLPIPLLPAGLGL